MLTIKEKVIEIRTVRDKSSFVDYFYNHPEKINELTSLIWNLEEYPYKEYASRILMHLVKSKRFDLDFIYKNLVDVVFKTDNQSVLRNTVFCINELQITDYKESEFIDLLISFVQDHKNKVALHVYSIYVLIQFCKKYPELTDEIQEIIELNQEGKTAAYRIGMRNFYTELKKV